VDFNVALPFASSALSLVFVLFLLDQWRERRRPYQLVWALGMLWYCLSAGTEFLGGWLGWSEPLYRLWYLIGAIWVAAWLGLGTILLLARTRFGYGVAVSFLLAGLFTYLSWLRYRYPESGPAPILYPLVALVVAGAVLWETYRGGGRWATWVAGTIAAGSAVAAVLALTAPLAPPGWAVDPVTRIPTGELFPGYLRLLTPLFNVTGAFALVLGAIYSTYVFIPKRRVIRYSLHRPGGLAPWLRNLLLAAVAIPVNLVASLPGAVAALLAGRLHSRVPATILIALGGLIPSVTSGANRFGATSAFFVGEFLGVLFIFAGFLVSIEVFREIRIPFTSRVLFRRRAEAG
jgi:hypothetical protein